MEMDAGPGCVQPDGDSAVLLAEFRGWLGRERGLSPVSVRCYSKQSKAFLAGIDGAGAVSGLDAGRVTAFMVEWAQGRNTWSAKAMVTSLRAFLRFAHATGRTAAPLAGAVPAVASWQVSSLPRGLKAAEIERLLAGVDTSVIALWLGHQGTETTQIYLHADMSIKEQALARVHQPGTTPGRYRPPDSLLTFLDNL